MIAVIDTNHLLRIAAAYRRSPLFAAWRSGRFELVVSDAIMSERQPDCPIARRVAYPRRGTCGVSGRAAMSTIEEDVDSRWVMLHDPAGNLIELACFERGALN